MCGKVCFANGWNIWKLIVCLSLKTHFEIVTVHEYWIISKNTKCRNINSVLVLYLHTHKKYTLKKEYDSFI